MKEMVNPLEMDPQSRQRWYDYVDRNYPYKVQFRYERDLFLIYDAWKWIDDQTQEYEHSGMTFYIKDRKMAAMFKLMWWIPWDATREIPEAVSARHGG